MHPVMKKLADCGQSIWYDNVQRGMLDSGAMQALVDDGVAGVTSNPTIFMKAVTASSDYDAQIRSMAAEGHDALAIYDKLTIDDIARTADILRPTYDRTNGVDGYVSIEVNPKLAFDTAQTLSEAKRIFATLGRPNVMIKIPGTTEGLPAIEDALAEGININVTLIFDADVYVDIMHAYRRGLARFTESGGDPTRVASVASFFVSRVDSAVDKLIGERAGLQDLRGKAAVANSRIAYKKYQEFLASGEFDALRDKGARMQRPLWASTSTKDPAYSPLLYVETLVGMNTVNTVPPATLDAIRSGMDVRITVTSGVDEAETVITRLADADISISSVTDELRQAGVKAFAESFDQLIEAIDAKRAELVS